MDENTGDVASLKRNGTPSKRKLDDHHEPYIIGSPGVTPWEVCSKFGKLHVLMSRCQGLLYVAFCTEMNVHKDHASARFIAHALQLL